MSAGPCASPAVLGIDPGTRKCGYAIVTELGAEPLALGIVPTERLAEALRELLERHTIRAVALGGGTHAASVGAVAKELGLTVTIVDERETTLLARERYFRANPPRGWRRLIPRGMLLPPRPIDDYAALLIAERLLQRPLTGP
jgi:RNase H-fold protein (predicted Holliday junction resolvase)